MSHHYSYPNSMFPHGDARGDVGGLVWKSFGASHHSASQIFAASPSFSAAKAILRGR